eukprot:INCI9332.2.p1 GENE.INCI9332.2~~INCI9332.2.p1  ORF type:complete len:513 (+),score=75.43 INCI9332.2:1219-2757(+)
MVPVDVAIVYTFKKATADVLASALQSQGIAACAYHSGSRDREGLLNKWLKGDLRVIVATIAFGMGIDHAGVRLVVHWDLPKSLSAYYQQAGRAGRDGVKALCVLYHSVADVDKQRYIIAKTSQRRSRKQEDGAHDRQSEEFAKVVAYCMLGREQLLDQDRSEYPHTSGTTARLRAAQRCRHAFTLREFDPSEIIPGPGGRCGEACDLCVPGGIGRIRRQLEKVARARQQKTANRKLTGFRKGAGRSVPMQDGVRFVAVDYDSDAVDSEEEWVNAQRLAEASRFDTEEGHGATLLDRVNASAFGIGTAHTGSVGDETQQADDDALAAFVQRREQEKVKAAREAHRQAAAVPAPLAEKLSLLNDEISKEWAALRALQQGSGSSIALVNPLAGQGQCTKATATTSILSPVPTIPAPPKLRPIPIPALPSAKSATNEKSRNAREVTGKRRHHELNNGLPTIGRKQVRRIAESDKVKQAWVTKTSTRTGRTYWFNTSTGESTYKNPIPSNGSKSKAK